MYRWVEHTGELELEIRAQDEHAVFVHALEAMAELLDDEGAPGPQTRADAPRPEGEALRELSLEAADRARLLAEFVGELAFLAETEGFVPAALEHLAIAADRLQATVRGRIDDPAHLVKAATYHRLRFEVVDGAWHARVVLDV